jgi:O-methyltransferase involved in polyketide biosynthesis
MNPSDATSRFDKSQKTLFLWEAVTQYISSAAVESVLQFVRENSAPGSHLAFDYKYQEALDGTKSYTGTGIADIVKFVSTCHD